MQREFLFRVLAAWLMIASVWLFMVRQENDYNETAGHFENYVDNTGWQEHALGLMHIPLQLTKNTATITRMVAELKNSIDELADAPKTDDAAVEVAFGDDLLPNLDSRVLQRSRRRSRGKSGKGSKKSKLGEGKDPCKSSKKSGKGKGGKGSKSSKSSGKKEGSRSSDGSGSSSKSNKSSEKGDECEESEAPSQSPSSPTFQCGDEQTSDFIDIIIAVDESLSMGPEQEALKSNVNFLFNTIATETNGLFRIGLVGYTGPNNRIDGVDQPVAVDPELKSVLIDDAAAFESAVDSLVVTKKPSENGRGTLVRIAQDQIQTSMGNFQSLDSSGGTFPTRRGFCAILIADELNQDYDDFPDPGNEAVIDLYSSSGSVIFPIGRSGDTEYQELASSTGGTFASVDDFLVNPALTLESIVQSCVARLCSEEELEIS